MAAAWVQSSAGNYNGGSGNAVDSLTGVAAGNSLIAVCLGSADPTSVATSNFSGSGAFTQRVTGASQNGGLFLSIWDLHGVQSGSHTITVTPSSGGMQIVIVEVSGIVSFTAASTLADGFNAAPTAASLTPAVGSWNLGVSYNGSSNNFSGWSPGTEIFDIALWRGLGGSAYVAPSPAGIITTATIPSGFWYCQTYSFAPVPPDPSVPIPRPQSLRPRPFMPGIAR